MILTLATLPVLGSGTAAAACAGEHPAGRDGARPAFGFLDQLAQALGTADVASGGPTPGSTTATEPATPALLVAADAQPGAPVSQAGAGTAPPDVAALPDAALPGAQALVAAPLPALPGQPAPADAAGPQAESGNDVHPAARSGERRSVAARPGTAADGVRRADGQQEQLPALPALATVPLPALIPAAPAQAASAEDAPVGNHPAEDGSVRDAQPGIAHLPGRHEPAVVASADAPSAAVPDVPSKAFAQHVAAAAPPGADKPEALPSPAQADALVPPGIASVGATAAAPPHAEPARQTAPASPAQSQPPSPAAQVTPALVHIAAAPSGAQYVTVRLDPVELGELRVRIERPREGPVHVTVEATRPETLQLLRQDQPALHRALDQAGLPPEGRVVVLQQASPEAGGQRGTTGDAGGSVSTGSGQGDGHGGNQGWGGSGSGGGPGDDAPRRTPWLRAGLDITA